MKPNVEVLQRSQCYADDLRERATKAERRMCALLDAAKISYVFQSNMCDMRSGRIYIADFKIKRQVPGRPKGVARKDWPKDNRKLFVEVDGGYHLARAPYDARRTKWMESHRNAIVLRFTNEQVFKAPATVVAAIEAYHPAKKTVYASRTSRSDSQPF